MSTTYLDSPLESPVSATETLESDEKPLWVSETPWPPGDIQAAVWVFPFLSLRVPDPWGIVADLDAYGISWRMIDDDDGIVLIYTPENDIIAETVLQDAGARRMDGLPFGFGRKSASDYQKPHQDNRRPLLFGIFRNLFGG